MLYIHIPFCHHKCTYCAFYSVARHRDTENYVNAICGEIDFRVRENPRWKKEKLRTVYIGGGTPSLLSASELKKIIDCVASHFDISDIEEATIEMNPEDATPIYLNELQKLHFFNRLSIGVQSFHNEDLRIINRVHNGLQALEAIDNAAIAGFDNVSVDLIIGIPSQSAEKWEENLAMLSRHANFGTVKHLSCYELTVEPHTMLDRQIKTGRVVLPDDDDVAARYRKLKEWCSTNGFEQYEVSNFCRPGYRSLHNSRYWNHTPYLGIGAAAHSFDGHTRQWNIDDWQSYIAGIQNGKPVQEEEHLTDKQLYNEYIMTSLRTTDGIDKNMVDPKYAENLRRDIQRYVDKGLIKDCGRRYLPSEEGLLHADGMAADLFIV